MFYTYMATAGVKELKPPYRQTSLKILSWKRLKWPSGSLKVIESRIDSIDWRNDLLLVFCSNCAVGVFIPLTATRQPSLREGKEKSNLVQNMTSDAIVIIFLRIKFNWPKLMQFKHTEKMMSLFYGSNVQVAYPKFYHSECVTPFIVFHLSETVVLRCLWIIANTAQSLAVIGIETSCPFLSLAYI